MAEIVNLRTRRKRLARDAAAREAAQNRVLHGRTRAERDVTEAAEALDAKRLNGHAMDRDRR
jgi:hypothetical protein